MPHHTIELPNRTAPHARTRTRAPITTLARDNSIQNTPIRQARKHRKRAPQARPSTHADPTCSRRLIVSKGYTINFDSVPDTKPRAPASRLSPTTGRSKPSNDSYTANCACNSSERTHVLTIQHVVAYSTCLPWDVGWARAHGRRATSEGGGRRTLMPMYGAVCTNAAPTPRNRPCAPCNAVNPRAASSMPRYCCHVQ